MGAGYRIETMPGYLPSLWQPAPEEMADAVKALAGEKTVYEVRPEEHSGGSTDVGDVQHLLPVITFNTGGAVGGLHQVDFDIVDEEEAYVLTARYLPECLPNVEGRRGSDEADQTGISSEIR